MAELTPDGIRFGNYTEQTTAEYPAFRNRIINGNMQVAQRGTSFAPGYTLDRWIYANAGAVAGTVTQSTDVPTNSGLYNSLRATVTTADTNIAAGEYSVLVQLIEGYNVADLVDVPITLSFWVRSSKTGIHCVSFKNSGDDRSYISEYIINSVNTWEKKSITVSSGLPTSGTWNFTNGRGLLVGWVMAAGSTYQTSTINSWDSSNSLSTANQVNCLDTVGNIFAITGVQLEKSPGATPFEFRNYEVELLLCQRYYSVSSASMRWGSPGSGQSAISPLYWPVVMRVAPTVTFNNHAGTTFVNGNNDSNVSSKSAINITIYGAGFLVNSINAGDTYSVYQSALASAEL